MTPFDRLRLAFCALSAALPLAAESAVTTWTSDPHGSGTIEDHRLLNDVWRSGPIRGLNGTGVDLTAIDTLRVDIAFGGESGLQLLDDGWAGGSTESLEIKVSADAGTSGTFVDYNLAFTGLRGNFQHANPITGTLTMGAGGSVDFSRDLDFVSASGSVFFTDLHLELTPKAGGAWAVNSVEVGLEAYKIKRLTAAPQQVPEPRSVVLMCLGIGLLTYVLRRRRRKAQRSLVPEGRLGSRVAPARGRLEASHSSEERLARRG